MNAKRLLGLVLWLAPTLLSAQYAPMPYPPVGGYHAAPIPYRYAVPVRWYPVQPRPPASGNARPAPAVDPSGPAPTAQPAERPSPPASTAAVAPATTPGGPVQPGLSRQEFLASLTPIVEAENRRLRALRQRISGLLQRAGDGEDLPRTERQWLNAKARLYRVKGRPAMDARAAAALLAKVDVIPRSLALAQAANESAWGQSRFAREGLNLFGIWTYDPDKGIVPRDRPPGATHLVRRFDSIEESVRHYMRTLNSHPAYARLRAIRAELREQGQPLDGRQLAEGLEKYSAKGRDYVRLIQSLIEDYDLAGLDLAAADG